MSQLIQLRQRIRAIETIKKITHAMRLISMSLHARLKHKEATLTHYHQATQTLFNKVKIEHGTWTHPVLYPAPSLSTKSLIILIGSNKGLCGNFNTALFKLFDMQRTGMLDMHYITIGKRATEYVQEHALGTIVRSYNTITFSTITHIAAESTGIIFNTHPAYTQVLAFSNILKTFFIQRPRMTQLIPFSPTASPAERTEYIWEQEPEIILNYLAHECIESSLAYLLFQSLLAEQAARFISMDASTRNAKSMLEETKSHYNKLRQTRITQELTELTSSF